MSDVQIYQEQALATADRVDKRAEWRMMVEQAEMMAQAGIIPSAYQRNPANLIAAGLAGQAFGWDIATSIRNFHIIEGTTSMRPEAMLALVRGAGHSVEIDFSDGAARAMGTRADNGDEHTATFDMNDAAAAGLTNKKNWKQYQSDMLQWRAVAKLCRALFGDVILGVSYVPEELGAITDNRGDVVDEWEMMNEFVSVAAPQAKQRLLDACNGDKTAAKEIWEAVVVTDHRERTGGDQPIISISEAEMDECLTFAEKRQDVEDGALPLDALTEHSAE